jgi:hypothetical protein
MECDAMTYEQEIEFHTNIMLYWQFQNPALAHKVAHTIHLLKEIYGTKNNHRQNKDQDRTIKWT